jgi:exodeoxyribonuclease VII large subunit
LSVYPPRGDYQLVIEELFPKGMGAQDLALRQLKEKLHKLGWFAAERKKPLPRFPACIGLVTSRAGAVVRDMLEVLGRRWPAAEVYVCPVRVQGAEAPVEIAAALRLLNRLRCVHVIILGRGGGGSEDLAAFNQEIVAKAIVDSTIPIVSAVGHEVDVTIADLVADRRALTPSEAAELVTPDRSELLQALSDRASRLTDLLCQGLRHRWERLHGMLERRAFQRPLERVQDLERRLDEIDLRLTRAVRQRVTGGRQAAEGVAARLECVSPLNVLARGYSLTRKEADNAVVRDAGQVRAGERLITVLARGQVLSRVEENA